MNPKSDGTSLSDQIREYVVERKLKPARERGESLVTVFAREIHAEMNLPARVKVVCYALDKEGFPDVGWGKLVERSGPRIGPAAKWVYEV